MKKTILALMILTTAVGCSTYGNKRYNSEPVTYKDKGIQKIDESGYYFNKMNVEDYIIYTSENSDNTFNGIEINSSDFKGKTDFDIANESLFIKNSFIDQLHLKTASSIHLENINERKYVNLGDHVIINSSNEKELEFKNSADSIYIDDMYFNSLNLIGEFANIDKIELNELSGELFNFDMSDSYLSNLNIELEDIKVSDINLSLDVKSNIGKRSSNIEIDNVYTNNFNFDFSIADKLSISDITMPRGDFILNGYDLNYLDLESIKVADNLDISLVNVDEVKLEELDIQNGIIEISNKLKSGDERINMEIKDSVFNESLTLVVNGSQNSNLLLNKVSGKDLAVSTDLTTLNMKKVFAKDLFIDMNYNENSKVHYINMKNSDISTLMLNSDAEEQLNLNFDLSNRSSIELVAAKAKTVNINLNNSSIPEFVIFGSELKTINIQSDELKAKTRLIVNMKNRNGLKLRLDNLSCNNYDKNLLIQDMSTKRFLKKYEVCDSRY